MYSIRSLLYITLIAIFISGCSTSVVMVSQPSQRVQAHDVEVIYDEPDRKYKTIAVINELAQTRLTSLDSGIKKCREQAAKVGADALIITNMKGVWTGWGGAGVDAKAVKWVD